MPAQRLAAWLGRLGNDNAQREYYLTDIVASAVSDGVAVEVRHPGAAYECLGANSKAELAALSPRGHLQQIAAPVYLLHGAGDTVIPPSESEWAAQELGAREHAALVTPLLSHVSVTDKPGLGDQLALLRFMSRML